MTDLPDHDLVLVVDFGAQYAQLIARRVREAKVYSEIVPHSTPVEQILARRPKAIILSGGPSSVYAEGAPGLDPTIFGAGVPVCALDYGACLAERVRHGDNGLLFSTARQLADVLFDLFETFPADQSLLERLRIGARKSARPTWEEGWAREARSVLLP